MSTPINVRLPDALRDELTARQGGESLSETLRREFDRHFAVLADGRVRAARILSPGEVGLICDALNGVITRDTLLWITQPLLAMTVADAAPHLAEKWSVDGPSLVAKLKSLDPASSLAVLDSVERFWSAVGRGEQADPREALK